MVKKHIFLLGIALCCAALLSSCFLLKNEELDKVTTAMVNALIARDTEKIQALTHPDYRGALKDLDAMFEAMAEDGIVLEGTLTDLTPQSRSYSSYNSEQEGKTTDSVYAATIGDQDYTFTLRTLSNDNGKGIIDFTLKRNN